MLIAEELVVLLHDEHGRATVDRYRMNRALAGALLAELALRGHVRLAEPDATVDRNSRIVAVPENPPADPLLAEAAELLGAKEGHKPKEALGTLRKLSGGLRGHLLQRLGDAGVLRRERRRALGVAPVTRWAAVDPVADLGVRTRLRDVLVTGRSNDERDTAFVAALAMVGRAHHNAGCAGDFERRQARRRAKRIAADTWAGKAALEAVRDERLTAAVSTAGTVVTIATAIGT